MKFTIMTLFPEMFDSFINTSIIGRATSNNLIDINTVNFRNYADNKYMHVDDYPYGGGAGMVIQPKPVVDCYRDITKDNDKKVRVIYLTPQGKVFNQNDAIELSKEDELIFLCGHYEIGRYAWILDNIRIVDEFSIKGKLGIWNFDK